MAVGGMDAPGTN